MNLYKRYLSGETAQVYQDIENLGADAFWPQYKVEVDQVLSETFQRVAYNLEIIYAQLKSINYQFKVLPEDVYQTNEGTTKLVLQLNACVSQFGYVPLSVQFFYAIVGGVNLCWNFENFPEIPWPLADPLEIDNLDVLVNTIDKEWWKEYTHENIADPEVGIPFIELAADTFHKDNISGGPPYAVQLTATPAVDSAFLFEKHETTFINYLRICFENCGFPGMKDPNASFQAFSERVRPLLKDM